MSRIALPKRTGLIAGLVAVLLITGSGVAFAWWSSLGTGNGTATTASSAATFTVTAGTQVGVLTPGGPDVTVPFTVTNAGDSPLRLKAIVGVTLADAQGAAWSAPGGCAAEAYHAVGSIPSGAGQVAPGGSVAGVVTISMDDLTTSQDACKGVQLPLHISVS